MNAFFAASAGVAGALVGLLFVAISVAADRLARAEGSGQLHRIRANAALLAFTNALAISLFALLPGEEIGTASLVVSIVGLAFVAAALLSLIRLWLVRRPAVPDAAGLQRQLRWADVRDAGFLIGLTVAFVYQLLAGIDVLQRPGDSGSVDTIGDLVIVFFLVGVARAWELIGGPSFWIRHEVVALVQGQGHGHGSAPASPDADSREEEPPASAPPGGGHPGPAGR